MDNANEQSPAVVLLMAITFPIMVIFGLRANAMSNRRNRPVFGSFLRARR